MHIVRRAADERRFRFNFQPIAAKNIDYLECFGHDFRTNAVTGHDCYFHASWSSVKQPGLTHRPRDLISFDFVGMQQSPADLVPTI